MRKIIVTVLLVQLAVIVIAGKIDVVPVLGGGFVPLSDDGLSVAGEFKVRTAGGPYPVNGPLSVFQMEFTSMLKNINI